VKKKSIENRSSVQCTNAPSKTKRNRTNERRERRKGEKHSHQNKKGLGDGRMKKEREKRSKTDRRYSMPIHLSIHFIQSRNEWGWSISAFLTIFGANRALLVTSSECGCVFPTRSAAGGRWPHPDRASARQQVEDHQKTCLQWKLPSFYT